MSSARARSLLVLGVASALGLALALAVRSSQRPVPAPSSAKASALSAPTTSIAAPGPSATNEVLHRSDYRGVHVFRALGPPLEPCGEYYYDEKPSLHRLVPGGSVVQPDRPDHPGPQHWDHVSLFTDLCPGTLLPSSAAGARPDLERYVPPDTATVRRAFAPDHDLFWMDGQAEECLGYRVAKLSARPNPAADSDRDFNLEAFTAQPVPEATQWGLLLPLQRGRREGPRIPFALDASAGHPPYLLFGVPQRPEGLASYACRCERLFRVLRFADEELHVLARFISGDPPAHFNDRRRFPTQTPAFDTYDPSEIERWFTSRTACERALVTAAGRIKQDGRQATRVGLHASLMWSDDE